MILCYGMLYQLFQTDFVQMVEEIILSDRFDADRALLMDIIRTKVIEEQEFKLIINLIRVMFFLYEDNEMRSLAELAGEHAVSRSNGMLNKLNIPPSMASVRVFLTTTMPDFIATLAPCIDESKNLRNVHRRLSLINENQLGNYLTNYSINIRH